MKLLIDAGNTRLKWRLMDSDTLMAEGADDVQGSDDWPAVLAPWSGKISRVVVSTVISEKKRQGLERQLSEVTSAPVMFHWSEVNRGNLVNSYRDVHTMGADRWHAMYGAWCIAGDGFAVVDAGSAITVDYVRKDGQHLGGYILSGKQMMLRSLRQDAARIGVVAAVKGQVKIERTGIVGRVVDSGAPVFLGDVVFDFVLSP